MKNPKNKKPRRGKGGRMSFRQLIRSKGFFMVLAAVAALLLLLFITSRIAFLAAQTNRAFSRDSDSEGALRFDIEGFQNLNLIRQ